MKIYHTPLIVLIIVMFTNSIFSQPPIPMDQFIGVNVLRQDPIERLSAVGFAREYHEWILSEGFPALNNPPVYENASPPYPDNLYRFNTSYQGQTALLNKAPTSQLPL